MSDSILLSKSIVKKKNLPESALDRNNAQLGFGHGPLDTGPWLRNNHVLRFQTQKNWTSIFLSVRREF